MSIFKIITRKKIHSYIFVLFFSPVVFLHYKKKTFLTSVFLNFPGFLYKINKKMSSMSFFRLTYEYYPAKITEYFNDTLDFSILREIMTSYTKNNDYNVDKKKLFDICKEDVVYCDILDKCLVEDIKIWCKKENEKIVSLKKQSIFNFSYPKTFNYIFPDKEFSLLVPESFVACLKNVIINKNASIIARRKGQFFWIVYEKQAHPKHVFVASYWKQFIYYDKSTYQLSIPKLSSCTRKIDQAILIDGRCSENYFHWTIEYLSRIYALEMQTAFKLSRIPFLVSSEMPFQHYQLLKIVAPNSPIIYYNPNQLLSVENLYVLSIPTVHYDDLDIPFVEGSSIDVDYLKFLRTRVLGSSGFNENKEKVYPRKIFVARPFNNSRSIINQKEIQTFLVKNGFSVIYPEKLAFIEQVCYFANADLIVGVNGAALTNLIFVKSTAIVFILINETNKEYCMQYNLAKFVSKCDVCHITGKPHGKIQFNSPYEQKMEMMKQSYSIDICELEKAILNCE